MPTFVMLLSELCFIELHVPPGQTMIARRKAARRQLVLYTINAMIPKPEQGVISTFSKKSYRCEKLMNDTSEEQTWLVEPCCKQYDSWPGTWPCQSHFPSRLQQVNGHAKASQAKGFLPVLIFVLGNSDGRWQGCAIRAFRSHSTRQDQSESISKAEIWL